MTQVLIWYAAALVIWGSLIWLLIRRGRRWDRKARRDRRLLVREGEQLVWRVTRGRVLVGWPSSDGRITAVYAPRNEAKESPYGDAWIVIQTTKGKLVTYRVTEKLEDQNIGVIEVYLSWPELQAVVPARIYEEAAREAGILRPAKYPELRLDA
jgi:hypothetical protein